MNITLLPNMVLLNVWMTVFRMANGVPQSIAGKTKIGREHKNTKYYILNTILKDSRKVK